MKHFCKCPTGTGKEHGFSVEEHRVWYVSFGSSPDCTTKSLQVLIVASSTQSYDTVFHSYSVFLTFCLCSWVQLKVPNVILECYCLQRNTTGKGHCSREKQHVHGQRQELLCALQRPTCPPKGKWHPRLGPAAHVTSWGCSTFQFWGTPSMLGDFPNSIVWGNQSIQRTWGARQKMTPS